MYVRLLRARAWVGSCLYRLGIIEQTTCFRWEMDAALGEAYKRPRSSNDTDDTSPGGVA